MALDQCCDADNWRTFLPMNWDTGNSWCPVACKSARAMLASDLTEIATRVGRLNSSLKNKLVFTALPGNQQKNSIPKPAKHSGSFRGRSSEAYASAFRVSVLTLLEPGSTLKHQAQCGVLRCIRRHLKANCGGKQHGKTSWPCPVSCHGATNTWSRPEIYIK